MKKSHFKIFMVIITALVLFITAFTIISLAESKYAKITFVEGDYSYYKNVALGEEFELPTPEARLDGTIYGWFDSEGNLYGSKQKITPTKNLTLYSAEGDELALSRSLKLYCQMGYSYIKLKSNISLDEPISLPKNKILYIDLNGNTINIETPAAIKESTDEEVPSGAFVGENCGVIFANSSSKKATINHTSLGDVAFSLGSLVSISPNSDAKALPFVIGENVSVSTNMNFVSLDTDISQISGVLSISVYGEINCGRLLRSSGINDGQITIYSTASVTSTSEFMIEDITEATDLLTLIVKENGKKIVVDGESSVESDIISQITLKTGFIKDHSRINTLIYGGCYSKDISSLIPNDNYSFEARGEEGSKLYYYVSCAHTGPLTSHAYICKRPCQENHVHCEPLCKINHTHCQCVLNHEHFYCETPRKLNHKCVHCGTTYEVDYPEGIGHSLKIELVQEPVNTKEETKEGIYRTYCTRGDYEVIDYAFPNPDSVYVTVKYYDDNGDVQEIRVPSQDLFSFDKSLKTKIMSFTADNVYRYDEKGNAIYIPARSIFYVEIPNGTTDIYGEMANPTNTPTPVGAFTNDYYLKEISLPTSIKNINPFAFFNMQSIEKIHGIENITGSIGTGAFMQLSGTSFSFDHLELNASSVGFGAFGNILITKTLTIGENVSSISDKAFALGLEIDYANRGDIINIADYTDQRAEDEITKEIFIVGYDKEDGVTLSSAKGSMGSGHQFSTLPIVFKSHDYITENIPATCISYGHDSHRCSRCSIGYTDNYVEVYAPHAYAEYVVPATCQKIGFRGEKCTIEGCGHINTETGEDLKLDPNNHTYAAGVAKYAINEGGYFCVDPYYTLKVCGCKAIQPDVESTIKFTYPGSTEETAWTFYMLENGSLLIYKDGKKIANESLGSMTITDGYFTKLTYNSFDFDLVKQTADVSSDDKLSGEYQASNANGIKFTVTISVGTRFNAFIPKAGSTHNYTETILVKPTCVPGLVRKTCADCKYTPEDEELSAVDTHTLEKVILQEATCSLVESGKFVCSVCGVENPYSFEGVFDQTKHTKKVNDEGVVVAEPSYQYPGQRRFQCKDCGGDIFEEIPKLVETNEKKITTTLIIIFASIPLAAGIILTFVFTFTKKKSKAAGYKFRFNTIKKGDAHSNKTVAEQLAEMNLTEELPPDVEISEDGTRDDEAAWTAYVDAINNDYTRTIELNLAKEAEEDTSIDEVTPDSNGNAWEAYVAAINKDYEETMELNLNAQNEEKSLADLMDDTVVDMSFAGYNQENGSDSEDETFDFGTLSGTESFDLGSTDEKDNN